ncbi:MFS general substrate transporter [Polyplosphaeria fusca]|uniref:MFS general substrate transporter n=1 Tax=Polyplosphaeria fusca TaxID=682080 RepID=A0A9P4QIU2_9PLEO|nr:MFS general substrate transporter [Polyplosphaeria fusca]
MSKETGNASVSQPSQPSQQPPPPPAAEPQQWPSWRKVVSVAVVSYADCLTFLVSMMLAPSVPQVLATFRPDGSDKFLGSFSVTVYILGFVFGPLLFGPLTDLMGRITILRFTATLYLIFTIACALSTSLPMLIVFRFIAGCFGGAPMAIGGGVVSDLYASGQRTRPMAWYSVGTMMGPTLGPVLGGLITGGLDWRWVFWIAAILAGLCVAFLVFLLEETHQATLIRRAASGSTTSSHSMDEKPALLKTISSNWKSQNVPRLLRRSITIPAKIVRHLPALAILLFVGIFNGLANMILSSLGSVFQFQYGFPPTTAGLAYLGLGIGGVCGLATTPRVSDYFSKRRPHPDGSKRPQHALPMIIIAGPMASIGLWWYGWSTQARVHWMVPIIGLAIFGFGYMSIRLSTQIFLVEAVPKFTASALAAHTIFSSLGGSFIPIGTFPLYDRVGYGWGNSVIAFINLGLWIVPLIMYIISLGLGNEWIVHIEA